MTTNAASTDRTREEAVLQRVVDMVEPLTGFNRAQFQDVSSTTERVVVTVEQHFQVGFLIAPESGVGRLPGSTVEVADSASAWTHVTRQKNAAQQELPDRLQRWLDSYGAYYAEALEPEHCLDYHAPVGYEGYCASCNGQGEVTCGTCNGKRRFTCYQCHGTTQTTCSYCTSGRRSCTQCGGRGSWTEYRTRTVTTGTHDNQVTQTENYTEYVTCFSCNGSGTQYCGNCGGTGSVTCSICSGSGYTNCATCQGNGSIRCRNCGATGWLHEQFQLRVSISDNLRFSANISQPEAEWTLESLGSISKFSALMEKIFIGYQIADETTINRSFTGELDVTYLSLSAAGTSYEMVAYGTPPQIFDYKNIVGQLLKGNLNELEAALSKSPRFLPWFNPRLSQALTNFLRDEANQQIAKRAAAAPDQLDRLAGKEFQQAVSADYVRRAVAALHSSIERVYWSGTVLFLPLLLLIPIAVLVLAELKKMVHFGPIPALIVGLSTIAVAILVEVCNRWRLKRRFAPAFGDTLKAVLNHTGTLRRGGKWLRGMTIGGALLGWIGGAVVLATIDINTQHAHMVAYEAKQKAARQKVAQQKAAAHAARLAQKNKKKPGKRGRGAQGAPRVGGR